MANTDRIRRMKATASRRGKLRAKERTCPDCGRQNAIRTIQVDWMFKVKKCKWCKYEKGVSL